MGFNKILIISYFSYLSYNQVTSFSFLFFPKDTEMKQHMTIKKIHLLFSSSVNDYNENHGHKSENT